VSLKGKPAAKSTSKFSRTTFLQTPHHPRQIIYLSIDLISSYLVRILQVFDSLLKAMRIFKRGGGRFGSQSAGLFRRSDNFVVFVNEDPPVKNSCMVKISSSGDVTDQDEAVTLDMSSFQCDHNAIISVMELYNSEEDDTPLENDNFVLLGSRTRITKDGVMPKRFASSFSKKVKKNLKKLTLCWKKHGDTEDKDKSKIIDDPTSPRHKQRCSLIERAVRRASMSSANGHYEENLVCDYSSSSEGCADDVKPVFDTMYSSDSVESPLFLHSGEDDDLQGGCSSF